jgi:hypothetical protein
MTQLRNPYQQQIDEASNLQSTLQQTTRDHELAIEAYRMAQRDARNTSDAYSAEESEFFLDLSYTDEYKAQKNAEGRKMVQDVALIKARQGGPLATAWRAKINADSDLFNAQLAFEQSEAKFKAVCTAAMLQGSMLKAAAIGW